MPRLTQIDPTQAQGETKDLFNAVQTKMGAVPNLIRVMGNQPAVLTAYLGNSAALQSGTFDAKTREAIALVTAGFNGCTYCASAHTYIAKSLNVDADESRRYIDGKSNDPKVQAVLTFSLRVLETPAKFPMTIWRQPAMAGWTTVKSPKSSPTWSPIFSPTI